MIRIQQTRTGGCCRFGTPESGFYHQVRALAFDRTRLVVSAYLYGTDEIESFDFRVSDGGFSDMRDDRPLVVGVLPDGRAVGFRVSPISQVVISG